MSSPTRALNADDEIARPYARALEHKMDLEQSTKIFPSSGATSNSVDEPSQISLFDAVRKWTDAEGIDAFEIELDGKRLTPEQIQEIAHSEDYKDRLLAFNERLG